MEIIPNEILHQIFLHIPKVSLASCRLVCRSFSVLAFPIQFSFIPQWLDYDDSHRAIVELAQDAFNRPAVMWSPWALASECAVEKIWMEIVWKFVTKREPPRTLVPATTAPEETRTVEEAREMAREGTSAPVSRCSNQKDVILTSGNFARLSGREEMTENRLRTSQNRYLLHRRYAGRGVGCFSPIGS